MTPHRKPAAIQPGPSPRRASTASSERPPKRDFDPLDVGPQSAGDRIDGLAATVSILKQRRRQELRRILADCYALLRDAGGSPPKLAEIDRELCERGQDPSRGREHALVWAVFRPDSREEEKRTGKYARALVALRRLRTHPTQARALLTDPGIEALSNMNAQRRKDADDRAVDSEEGADPAASPTTVTIPPAVLAAVQEAPTGWIPVELCLAGPRGKAAIRLPRKRG